MRGRPRHGRPQAAAPGLGTLSARLRRGRVLEDQPVLDGHCLIPVDGTGHFSSKSVHRHHCRLASRSDGSKGHSNGMPAAVVRHPERREVPPPAPEPVARTDGDRRNDRQRNAAARSVDDLRRGHPRLKAIVLQDGPASNGPHIARLRRHGLRFIPGGRPGDHGQLSASLDASPDTRTARFADADGTRHDLRYLNGAPVNASHPDIRASVTGYRETVIRTPLPVRSATPAICAARAPPPLREWLKGGVRGPGGAEDPGPGRLWSRLDGASGLRGAVTTVGHRALPLLVERGADVTVAENAGSTLVHLAAHLCSSARVSMLAAVGADVNACDSRGRTPSHLAAGMRSMDTVECPVRERADITLVDMEGRTAFGIVVESPIRDRAPEECLSVPAPNRAAGMPDSPEP